jgi:hypothetical protein
LGHAILDQREALTHAPRIRLPMWQFAAERTHDLQASISKLSETFARCAH